MEEFLYDLHADPYELSNIIWSEGHREVKEDMKGRLIRRMMEAGEEKPTIESAPTEPSRRRRLPNLVFPGD